MERRDFLKKGSVAVVAATVLPSVGLSAMGFEKDDERKKDKWHQLANGKKGIPLRKKSAKYDVAVVGAGMAGICAAVASARNGAKTVLIQDRPVLGGNASSEMRVTVNGVQGLKGDRAVERETGIIEEILIANWHYNPQSSYPVWDHVLYDFVVKEPNLTLMLNTQAVDVKMKGDKIKTVICWQSTSETEFSISAEMFIDSSGDGLMAATAGAEYRTGREGKAEFNESFAPEKPDGWVMGDCIMMISKDMGVPTPYYPPSYALKYEADKAFDRDIKQFKEGFWWVELGSDFDVIAIREENRHKLMGYLHGVWDYIKNSGHFPESANFALEWVGSIPGRRESRRFMGDYILTQKDMEEYRHFNDAVAYGGWSLDEHCPGGIENLSEPPSYFHAKFKKPYEIPFRCLYSKNVSNLLLAGRNVSVSHMALSSTRIIATCSMMGQAVGTASAMCVKKSITPRKLGADYINDLQEQLLIGDSFIPNRPANDNKDLARTANLILASSTSSGDVKLLLDGISRDEVSKIHHWQSNGLNAEVQLEWEKSVDLASVVLKCDTNLQRLIMMHKNPEKYKNQVQAVPPELMKTLSCEARINGKWVEVASVENNLTRLVQFNFPQVKATAVRVKLKETWGAKNAKLFEIRCYS